MELQIYNAIETRNIEWNFEEIKTQVKEQLEKYRGLVYTEEQVKDAEKDKATLNKFIKAIEDKRKEVKKECMKPYEIFEKEVKEVVALVNEPLNLIDAQIKEFEEKRKAEKTEEIKLLFETSNFPAWLRLEQIWNTKWTNKTYKHTEIGKEFAQIKSDIEKNIEMLSSLPAFSFEAIEIYKDTLDVNKAILEGQRLADIQKRKEEEQARKEAEEQARKEQEEQARKEQEQLAGQYKIINTDMEMSVDEKTEQATIQAEPKQWVSFSAHLTVTQARELKEFFNSRKIEFKAI